MFVAGCPLKTLKTTTRQTGQRVPFSVNWRRILDLFSESGSDAAVRLVVACQLSLWKAVQAQAVVIQEKAPRSSSKLFGGARMTFVKQRGFDSF